MDNNRKYMRIALALAARGRGSVNPNPMVGAVVVKGGRIVGKGYHEYFGGPHAEINALESAGAKAKGADLYVTLEPCSRWGKTPPCTERIIKAGIKRVICGMPDVNPCNRLRGIRFLKKNGVKVINYVLYKNACDLNKKYLSTYKMKSKITVKFAVSLDGKIAANTGDSRWITGEKARGLVHKLRSDVDGVLVGIGTVLKDDPELTSHGAGSDPARIVIDPSLKIPERSKILSKKAPVIIIYSTGSSDKIARVRKKAILLKLKSRKGIISFMDIVNKLSEISIRNILIEGGGETIAEALKARVVDETYAFIAPIIIGGRNAKTAVEGKGISFVRDAIKLKNVKISRLGGDLLVKGKNVYRDN